MTSWVRAGLVASVLSGAPSTALALRRGEDPLGSTEAVGSVVLGPSASRLSRIPAGGIVHVVISLLWARVIALVLTRGSGANQPRHIQALAGAVCGLGIAVFDLGVVGRHLPPIRDLPTGPQVADHLAYGALVGWVLKRPS